MLNPLGERVRYTVARKICEKTNSLVPLRAEIKLGRTLRPSRFISGDPFEYHCVAPQNVRYSAISHSIPSSWGRIEGGEWEYTRFDETVVYQAVKRRYEGGVEWEQTEEWKTHMQKIDDGEISWGCSNREELNSKFRRLDDVVLAIKRNGYKTQRALSRSDEWVPPTDDCCHPFLNEVSVNIGPDGELIRVGSGRHRLAIAKILDLEEIPVLVRTRHREWVAPSNE